MGTFQGLQLLLKRMVVAPPCMLACSLNGAASSMIVQVLSRG